MNIKGNFYELLYCDDVSDTETNLEDILDVDTDVDISVDVSVDMSVNVQNDKINSEFLNSESIANKNCRGRKRYLGLFHKKEKENEKWKRNFKIFRYPIKRDKIFDEMCNLPSSLQAAYDSKQNLTLKQILVLMNLHAMPGMVVNVIHDKIQLQVKKMMIKISHDGRVFHVSYYHWYDLKDIEIMIDNMFNTY